MLGRKIKVVITFPEGQGEPIEYDERMNISFTVNKTMADNDNGVNNAEILISNLSNDSRQRIEKCAASESEKTKGGITTVTLYAGHKDYNVIFTGGIRNVKQDRIGTDINTTIFAYDKTLTVPITVSVKNKSVRKLLIDEAKKKGFSASIDIEDRMVVDYAFEGSFRDFLLELSKDYHFSFFVNDGVLFVYDKNKPKKTAKIISRFNGLTGIPRISEEGCIIQSVLNPANGLGDLVTLDASFGDFNIGDLTIRGGLIKGTDISGFNGKYNALNGDYIVKFVTHKGESRADIFTTTLETIYTSIADIERNLS